MRIVASTENELQWISEKLELIKDGGIRGISVLSDKGELYGVCAMDQWSGASVQLHIVIDNPLCLKGHMFLREVFNYIFNTAGRMVAMGFVASDNEKALRFDKKIGFKEIARVKDGIRAGTDTVILALHRNDCRWID